MAIHGCLELVDLVFDLQEPFAEYLQEILGLLPMSVLNGRMFTTGTGWVHRHNVTDTRAVLHTNGRIGPGVFSYVGTGVAHARSGYMRTTQGCRCPGGG